MAKKPEQLKTPETSLMILTTSNEDQLPDYLRKDGPGRGSEDVGTSDLVIPRLEIVQALSPCRQRNKPEYIDGAEEGVFYNNVTRQLYGEEVFVIPVMFRKEWQLWLDRKKAGGAQGFRGAFQTDLEARARKDELPQNEQDIVDIIEAHVHFCLIVVPSTGRVEEICLTMSRSKMKVSKRWNSLIRMFGGDRFSRVYKLITTEESGDLGDYFSLTAVAAGFPTKELYERAEQLYDAISAGQRNINRDFDADDISDAGADDI